MNLDAFIKAMDVQPEISSNEEKVILKQFSALKPFILKFLEIQNDRKQPMELKETMKRVRVMNQVVAIITAYLVKSGKKGRQVDYKELDLIAKISGVKRADMDGTSRTYINTAAWNALNQIRMPDFQRGGSEEHDNIRRALRIYLKYTGYTDSYEIAWEEYPQGRYDSDGKFTVGKTQVKEWMRHMENVQGDLKKPLAAAGRLTSIQASISQLERVQSLVTRDLDNLRRQAEARLS